MKFNNILIVFSLTLLFSACNGINKPKKPKNLIAEDKMVNILIDISLLNAAKGSNKIVLENKGVKPQEYIYNKYAIDSVQFTSSNAYYAHNFDKYQSIYAKVNDSLKVLKEVYEAKEKEEAKLKKKEKDSLNEIRREKIKIDSIIPYIDKPKKQRPKLIDVREPLPDS